MKRHTTNLFRAFLWTLALLVPCLIIVLPGSWHPITAAHGGVIIDGGFTDHYEWIAMASPYPVTPGETIITVLIYDIETYAPIDGLSPTLELSPPGEPRPCCSGDQTLGPLPLIVDPVLYPGDYSNIAPLLREGAWQGKFTIQEDDPVGPGELTEIFFTVDIREAKEDEVRVTPLNAPMISLTATAVAKDFTAGGGGAEPAANKEGIAEEGENVAYPEPVAAIVPNNIDGLLSNSNEPSEEVGVNSTPYPPPSSVEGELSAESPDNRVAANTESSEADAAKIKPLPSESLLNEPEPSDPSVAEKNATILGSTSWATQNIWLLAALALIPVLLVVIWLLISNNKADETLGR